MVKVDFKTSKIYKDSLDAFNNEFAGAGELWFDDFIPKEQQIEETTDQFNDIFKEIFKELIDSFPTPCHDPQVEEWANKWLGVEFE